MQALVNKGEVEVAAGRTLVRGFTRAGLWYRFAQRCVKRGCRVLPPPLPPLGAKRALDPKRAAVAAKVAVSLFPLWAHTRGELLGMGLVCLEVVQASGRTCRRACVGKVIGPLWQWRTGGAWKKAVLQTRWLVAAEARRGGVRGSQPLAYGVGDSRGPTGVGDRRTGSGVICPGLPLDPRCEKPEHRLFNLTDQSASRQADHPCQNADSIAQVLLPLTPPPTHHGPPYPHPNRRALRGKGGGLGQSVAVRRTIYNFAAPQGRPP